MLLRQRRGVRHFDLDDARRHHGKLGADGRHRRLARKRSAHALFIVGIGTGLASMALFPSAFPFIARTP